MPKRDDSREDGFSLIELMIVVLVIGILVGVAVPSLLKTQNNAKAKAAQSHARSALSAMKVFHTDHETYWKTSDAATLSLLRTAEPSLGWVATMGNPSATPDQVSWSSSTSVFIVAVKAVNGDCFYVRDDTDRTSAMPGTWFGKTVGVACDANDGTPTWKPAMAQGWPADGASA